MKSIKSLEESAANATEIENQILLEIDAIYNKLDKKEDWLIDLIKAQFDDRDTKLIAAIRTEFYDRERSLITSIRTAW